MYRTVYLAAAGVGLGVLGLGATRYWYSRRLSKMTVSKNHTNESALLHLLAYDGMAFMGGQYANNLEMECRNFKKTQDSLALSLMRAAAPSEYGKKYNLAALSNVEMLRDQHPITNSDDYEDIVAKVAAGQSRALFGPQTTIKQLGRTSGTSGSHRNLVTTDDYSRAFFLYGVMVAFDTLFRWVPDAMQPQKDLKLMFQPKYEIAEGSGLRIGPNASTPEDVKTTASLYSTPVEAYECDSERDTLYLHLLFALRDADLGLIESNFASGVLDALTLLEDPKIRKALVGDIARGTISQEHTESLAPHAREALLTNSRGDRERAAQVLRSLLAHDERGKRVQRQPQGESDVTSAAGGWRSTGSLVRDLWPKLRCVLAVTTGQFSVYKDVLRRKYLPPATELPIYSPFYAATEGLIGVNVAPFDDGLPPPEGKRGFFVEALRDGLRGAGSAAEAPPPGPPPPRPPPSYESESAAPRTGVPQGQGEEEKTALATLTPEERAVAERVLPLGGGTLPAENAYLLHPRAMVFELLPIDRDAKSTTQGTDSAGEPKTAVDGGATTTGSTSTVRKHQEGGAILPSDAVVGQSYELVATNLSGLWRCRIGDVVRVIGKHRGQVPVVLFEKRQGQVLNAKGEKSNEMCLLRAMERLDEHLAKERKDAPPPPAPTTGSATMAAQAMGAGQTGGPTGSDSGSQGSAARKRWHVLSDFTFVEPAIAAESGVCEGGLSRYTAYVEIAEEGGASASEHGVDLGALSKVLDDGLRDGNSLYADFRNTGRMQAPCVIAVRPGAFSKVRQQLVEAGAGPSQAKVPRVTRNPDVVQLLQGTRRV